MRVGPESTVLIDVDTVQVSSMDVTERRSNHHEGNNKQRQNGKIQLQN